MKSATMMKCELCKYETKVEFKKPDRYTASVGKFTCPQCDCVHFFHVKKANAAQVLVTLKVLDPGNGLFFSSIAEDEATTKTEESTQ